jgi:hypothetical protein
MNNHTNERRSRCWSAILKDLARKVLQPHRCLPCTLPASCSATTTRHLLHLNLRYIISKKPELLKIGKSRVSLVQLAFGRMVFHQINPQWGTKSVHSFLVVRGSIRLAASLFLTPSKGGSSLHAHSHGNTRYSVQHRLRRKECRPMQDSSVKAR